MYEVVFLVWTPIAWKQEEIDILCKGEVVVITSTFLGLLHNSEAIIHIFEGK